MFASFAKISGFSSQWQVASEEQFIRRTLSGDVGAVAAMLETIGATLPAPSKGEIRDKKITYTPHGKVAMIRYLDDPLTHDAKVIRGHASGAWALFCAASSAALKGDRTLCDTFDTDCVASHDALKAAANKARTDKAAAVKAAAPAADPVATALDIVNTAVNAGTLTAAQVDYLRNMVERLTIKV